MAPVSEYTHLPVGSTVFDAVLALEHTQEEYNCTQYKHRAVLIVNNENKIVGKLNHADALCALDPGDEEDFETNDLLRFGFSGEFVRKLHHKRKRSETLSLERICESALSLKVENLMRAATDSECIDHDANLSMAIHQLAEEKLYSLLVTKGDDIIGILRMTDVFSAVYHTMVEFTGTGRES